MVETKSTFRIFKTKRFARDAKRAQITDVDLCKAIKQVLKGQADDLGGGVYKKRLKENQYRSIILGKGKRFWVYIYLFAKKDQDNITDAELGAFKKIAQIYATKTESDIQKELKTRELVEICYAKEI